jgi:hypothetical protein
MYSSGVKPSLTAASAISRVRLFATPFWRPPVFVCGQCVENPGQA